MSFACERMVSRAEGRSPTLPSVTGDWSSAPTYRCQTFVLGLEGVSSNVLLHTHKLQEVSPNTYRGRPIVGVQIADSTNSLWKAVFVSFDRCRQSGLQSEVGVRQRIIAKQRSIIHIFFEWHAHFNWVAAPIFKCCPLPRHELRVLF